SRGRNACGCSFTLFEPCTSAGIPNPPATVQRRTERDAVGRTSPCSMMAQKKNSHFEGTVKAMHRLVLAAGGDEWRLAGSRGSKPRRRTGLRGGRLTGANGGAFRNGLAGTRRPRARAQHHVAGDGPARDRRLQQPSVCGGSWSSFLCYSVPRIRELGFWLA